MKLVLVKCGGMVVVGEIEDRSSVAVRDGLRSPMVLQFVKMPQPARIHGKAPQIVTGFEFVTIPCGEIFLNSVDYWGEVKKHDPVYVTYYKVLEVQKQQEADPLMISQ